MGIATPLINGGNEISIQRALGTIIITQVEREEVDEGKTCNTKTCLVREFVTANRRRNCIVRPLQLYKWQRQRNNRGRITDRRSNSRIGANLGGAVLGAFNA